MLHKFRQSDDCLAKEQFNTDRDSGFIFLPITPDHILTNASLPFHHRDPFDRLLIAQAKREGFSLISKDQEFEKYNINLIWDTGR